MKCPKCGQEVQGNFCQNCGAKISQETTAAPEQQKPKQKPKKKKHGCLIALIVVFAFFVIVAAIGGGSETEAPESVPSDVSSSSQTPAEPEETTAPVTYEATNESMQQLFENTFDFDYDELSCSLVEEEGVNVCNISYKNTSAAWDESAFVRQVLSTFVDFQRLAYNVDGIGAVRFEVWQDMTDDRGNTASDLCYQFTMNKDAFSLYNWDTLSGHPILDQMQRDCSEFYIHPGILKNVKADDVIYHSLAF